MTVHTIIPERETLHGAFSRDNKPALTIHSGDTVRYRTLDGGWGLGPYDAEGKRERFPRRPVKDSGHALCGPVFVYGAEPGMTLEVRINDIVPGSWGWSSAGGFPHEINKRLGLENGDELLLNWSLDAGAMVGTSHKGHKVGLKPFMGVMGMPPDEPGDFSTFQPRHCGGNIDCKELVPGSTLYLPIPVAGALFSVGDGYAVQGDGEVGVPALECPMELVDLTLSVRDDLRLVMPRARTSSGWLAFGFHHSLDEAAAIALDGMLGIMNELYGYSRKEALALASLVVDMRITQLVNGIKGVHAVLPHGSIR